MSLSAILSDAEKIAGDLIPPTSVLGPVVGVLIKQVEKLAGAELTNLEDKALGIAPPEPAAPVETATAETVSPAESGEQSELDQLKAQVAALVEREASLAQQVADYQAKQAEPVQTATPTTETPAQ